MIHEWPLIVEDILGSTALVVLAGLTLRRAYRLQRDSVSVVWEYLFALSGAFVVFAVSRSVNHLVPYVLVGMGYEGVWTNLAPVTGAFNTLVFTTVAVLTLFYGRVVDQNDRLHREIDDRRTAEEELRAHRKDLEETVAERTKSLRKFREAVEHAGHAICIMDSEGQIEYVNPAFEDVTKYDASDAVGSTLDLLMPDDDDGETVNELWQTVVEGEVQSAEVRTQRATGETYPAYQTMAPIDTDETVDAYVCIHADISNRKALERDLSERNRQLTVLERIFRHNLRNEMNVIKGYADMITESGEGDTVEYADQIASTSDSLLSLVEKERAVTELLSDQSERTTVEVDEVVHRAVSNARDRYPGAKIRTTVTESETAIATPELQTALEELVDNAIRHAEYSRPTVAVDVEAADSSVCLSVADDGPGIAEMERDVLTGDTERQQLYHGSGLGLWLVRLIVRQSGGALDFEERDPRGTIVSIELQRAEGRDD